MDEDNIQDKLKELLSKTGGTYNILEEQIDVELQIEFFELVNKLMKNKRNPKEIIADKEKLYDANIDIEEKKQLLAELSNTEKAETYRIIEKFIEKAKENMKPWAILALQHCRIGLETYLLDEQQVFISTGLGGKEEKLRYFIVCKLKESAPITSVQKKVVQTEFEISFKTFNSGIEKISYFDNYFSVIGLIPINISINEVIQSSITESNHFGGFIHDKYLVTNVKILKVDEINRYFKNKGI